MIHRVYTPKHPLGQLILELDELIKINDIDYRFITTSIVISLIMDNFGDDYSPAVIGDPLYHEEIDKSFVGRLKFKDKNIAIYCLGA